MRACVVNGGVVGGGWMDGCGSGKGKEKEKERGRWVGWKRVKDADMRWGCAVCGVRCAVCGVE